MKRKLRMGMVGGGNDAFIGAVHRIAAFMDGKIELVCGTFSVNRETSLQSGRDLFVPEERVYENYEQMILEEAKLPEGERMDFVTIVTPNFLHFAPAKMAMDHGFDVVVEKPMTVSLEEALELQATVERTGRTLCLTHTYSGYPMVKQAKAMVKEGHFGKIRKIVVEYPQGWLSRLSEREGNAGAAWRADPTRSGKSLVMGDIGTHAAHLAEYVSGLKITELCADLTTFVEGRLLDDDGSVLLRFEDGAKGVLMASQISAGEENAVRIRIYGEKGGLEWANEDPNNLIIKMLDQPRQYYRTGNAYAAPFTLSSFATHNTRIPAGHPEGLLESFANIYRNFALTVSAKNEGRTASEEALDFPTVQDGVRGMAFIETVVKSNESNEKMDKICHLDSFENIISFINQAKEHLSPDFLIILLGPTASGKTALAVRIAHALDAEIISADSRQVYQHLDIGTGKDLKEYGDVPYHLIDIVPPTAKYSVENFKKDFQEASQLIRQKGKQVILCGGTGSYIHSLLIAQPYAGIPKNQEFQDSLASFSKEELSEQLESYEIPTDFHIDRDSKKRLIRSLEILNYLKHHEAPEKGEPIVKDYLVLGLNPGLTDRRSRIDRRLDNRLEEGLLAEVESLLAKGLSHEDLMWFGLEYKYASLYLSGEMSLADFKSKLRTEIHRYAKRQMTFFRKMEKDGVKIHWIEAKE